MKWLILQSVVFYWQREAKERPIPFRTSCNTQSNVKVVYYLHIYAIPIRSQIFYRSRQMGTCFSVLYAREANRRKKINSNICQVRFQKWGSIQDPKTNAPYARACCPMLVGRSSGGVRSIPIIICTYHILHVGPTIIFRICTLFNHTFYWNTITWMTTTDKDRAGTRGDMSQRKVIERGTVRK